MHKEGPPNPGTAATSLVLFKASIDVDLELQFCLWHSPVTWEPLLGYSLGLKRFGDLLACIVVSPKFTVPLITLNMLALVAVFKDASPSFWQRTCTDVCGAISIIF